MTFPEPVIGLAVEPKTQKDLDKLGIALAKLAEEDPTFTVRTDEESRSDDHQRYGRAAPRHHRRPSLRREFGVEINQGAPQVNYKESLTKTVQHREVFKKQTGGRGKFADIIFEIGPAEDGKNGFCSSSMRSRAATSPRSISPAVQKGFDLAMANGALAGYKMDSMKITLVDGSFHPVDSDQLSFEICRAQRFPCRSSQSRFGHHGAGNDRRGRYARGEHVGDIIGDLNKRRGQIQGMESKGTARVVKAKVPPVGDVRLRDRVAYHLFGSCNVVDGVLALRGRSPPTWLRRSSRSRTANVRI